MPSDSPDRPASESYEFVGTEPGDGSTFYIADGLLSYLSGICLETWHKGQVVAHSPSRFSLDANSGDAARGGRSLRAGGRAPSRRLVALAFALLLPPALLTAQAPASSAKSPTKALYTLVELPGLSSGSLVVARASNASGQIVGRSGGVTGTDTRAVLWTSGLAESLGALPGGDYSAAFGINRRGDVVGSSNTATAVRAFLWSRGRGMRDLGTLPGDVGSEAFDINSAGEIVGSSNGPRGVRAVLWDRAGNIEDLGVLPGGDYAKAVKLNDAGQVIGVSNGDSGMHAFLWTREQGMRDLGTLPGFPRSEAIDINRSGQIVGNASGTGAIRAFLWTPEGGMRDLGAFAGGVDSKALGIDDSGRVVGAAMGSAGLAAFVWTPQGGMEDLNASIPPAESGLVLSEGQGIGELGQIVVITGGGDHGPAADHVDEEHLFRSFVLTP
jgi:probable HAF family extracellular repeat protein